MASSGGSGRNGIAAGVGDDPYGTLGLDVAVAAPGNSGDEDNMRIRIPTEKEISRAYRKLALKYHPDKNPGDARAATLFQKVKGAYEILQDSKKRKEIDAKYHARFEQLAKRRKLDAETRKMRDVLEARERRAAAEATVSAEDAAAAAKNEQAMARIRHDNYEFIESIRHNRLMERKRLKEELEKKARRDEGSATEGVRGYISSMRQSLCDNFPNIFGACQDAHDLACPFLNKETQILAALARVD